MRRCSLPTFAVLGLIASSLSGCYYVAPTLPEGPFVPIHMVAVVPETPELKIDVQGEGPIPAAALVEIDRFIARFLDRRSGPLTIVTRGGAGDAGAPGTIAQAVVERALARGIPGSWVVREANAGVGARDVLLRYRRYAVEVPECGDFRVESAYNAFSTPHPNYGCAHARNQAVLAVDPADLLRARPSDASDAQRLNLVIQRYRAGEIGQSAGQSSNQQQGGQQQSQSESGASQ